MNENRLIDYLEHMQQAAMDACDFVQGMAREDFQQDKRTQQAVIMSLIIVGEAATKVMDSHADFAQEHPQVPWRGMRGMRNRMPTAISTLTWTWCGTPCRTRCRTCSVNCLPCDHPLTAQTFLDRSRGHPCDA